MPYVVNDGLRIRYRVEGTGPALILQHGFADSSETFYERGYVDALQAKYRIILPDTRGHGESDKPHDQSDYTQEKFVGDIRAILDDLGVQKAIYWGYSQGGWIGFAMAQHVADRISGFVLGGAAGAGSAFPTEPGKEDPLISVLQSGTEATLGIWGKWLTPGAAGRLRANDVTALIACRRERLATGEYLNLGKIAVPTVLYAGSADPIHEPARRSASQIPGATFISLPGEDHISVMCQPDLVLPQVTRFLEQIR
jgi:pimeloyl-ACP methyl ester carboxylesterase